LKRQKADIIAGYHGVREALLSGLPLNAVYLEKGKKSRRLSEIRALARRAGVKVLEVPRAKLDELSSSLHQGIVAVASPVKFYELDELIEGLDEKAPILVAVDGITDVRNMGSIIRTCDAVGVSGVIIPERNTAPINDAVVKASSGAVFHVPIVRVKNLSRALERLKEKGFWVALLSPEGDASIFDFNEVMPFVLVFGSEEKGPRQKVREKADFLLRIPQRGKIQSLNVSVAAGVALYELARKRGWFQ